MEHVTSVKSFIIQDLGCQSYKIVFTRRWRLSQISWRYFKARLIFEGYVSQWPTHWVGTHRCSTQAGPSLTLGYPEKRDRVKHSSLFCYCHWCKKEGLQHLYLDYKNFFCGNLWRTAVSKSVFTAGRFGTSLIYVSKTRKTTLEWCLLELQP
jgi:hypothetical protein